MGAYPATKKTGAQYQEKFNLYETRLAQKKAEEKRKAEAYAAKMERLEAERIRREEQLAEMAEERRKQNEQLLALNNEVSGVNIVRAFSVAKFGVYNCDRPFRPRNPKLINPRFTDASGQKLNVRDYYHVDKQRNTLYHYYTNSTRSITFNSESENLIFMVLENGKVAGVMPEEFATLPHDKGNVKFVMKEFPVELDDAQAVRDFLIGRQEI